MNTCSVNTIPYLHVHNIVKKIMMNLILQYICYFTVVQQREVMSAWNGILRIGNLCQSS